MSYILGLTGGIATGKSHLSGVLRQAGAMVVDADQISRGLTAPGGAALSLIREAFGEEYVPGGVLDRKKLGERVFGDPDALNTLNRLIHPLIFAETDRLIAEGRRGGVPVIVLDAPLLYETGMDRRCDEVWCAWIPRKLQLDRLMARDGFSRGQAMSRIASQMSAWEKRRRADRYIDTRGTMDESADQVLRMYRELLECLGREGKHDAIDS